jgi:hypothetical protein
MAKVYGALLCTLSALNSKDRTEGCRINANIQSSLSRYFDVDLGPRRLRIFDDEPTDWHSEYGDDPYRHGEYGNNSLRKRAWTLQERELSIRNIHFSRNMVLWECKEKKASNQLTWHEMKPEDVFQPRPIRNDPSESLAPSGPVSLRHR